MEGELDGLKIAEYINSDVKIPFIFITSHSDLETIKKIIELKPSGYITKPFKRSDIFASLNLVAGFLTKRNKVLIKDGHKTIIFDWDEINYIEGEGNYINVFAGSRKVVARQSMDSIIEQLDREIYFKIHRSYIVNLNKILKFNRKEVSIGNVTIPVSRNVQEELEQKLKSKS
jgi:DNA-binding LytR/AlgR family response regulator